MVGVDGMGGLRGMHNGGLVGSSISAGRIGRGMGGTRGLRRLAPLRATFLLPVVGGNGAIGEAGALQSSAWWKGLVVPELHMLHPPLPPPL